MSCEAVSPFVCLWTGLTCTQFLVVLPMLVNSKVYCVDFAPPSTGATKKICHSNIVDVTNKSISTEDDLLLVYMLAYLISRELSTSQLDWQGA